MKNDPTVSRSMFKQNGKDTYAPAFQKLLAR